MGFWKKLSFNCRCIIGFVGGTLIIFCLLLFSCMGGIDDYTAKIESLATESATAFYIEWPDGTEQEIDEFCVTEDENGKTISELTLITKKRVQVTSFLLAFTSLPPNTTMRVYVVGLGETNEGQATSSQVKTENNDNNEEVELGKAVLVENEEDLFIEVNMSNLVTIEKDIKIYVTFSSTVTLEYIAVDFEEIQEEVSSSNA